MTVTVVVFNELQPVALSVKTNVAVPAFSPVTIPLLVTEAIVELLLNHVPPDEGDRVVVASLQILLGPVTDTVGLLFTIIFRLGSELHCVVEFVKTKLAVPH